jgi:hypothetical protein
MIEENPVDQLFDEWEKRHRGSLFVRDGIVNEAEWRAATKRIVFLLKENNCGPSSVSFGATHEEQRDFRLLCNKRPWAEIGQWSYGLLNLPSSPTFGEAEKHRDAACRQVAIINLKKTAGGNASSSKVITQFALRDQDLLRKQVGRLDPSIVVCCGKDLVFSLAQKIFLDDAAEAEEKASAFVLGCRTPVRILRAGPSKIWWIDFVHPSMRRGSREKKYEQLMELCRSTTF